MSFRQSNYTIFHKQIPYTYIFFSKTLHRRLILHGISLLKLQVLSFILTTRKTVRFGRSFCRLVAGTVHCVILHRKITVRRRLIQPVAFLPHEQSERLGKKDSEESNATGGMSEANVRPWPTWQSTGLSRFTVTPSVQALSLICNRVEWGIFLTLPLHRTYGSRIRRYINIESKRLWKFFCKLAFYGN